jgi:hypothetical protein
VVKTGALYFDTSLIKVYIAFLEAPELLQISNSEVPVETWMVYLGH